MCVCSSPHTHTPAQRAFVIRFGKAALAGLCDKQAMGQIAGLIRAYDTPDAFTAEDVYGNAVA